MLTALESALEGAIANPSIRAVALVADGPAGAPFCHGMNLDSLATSLDADNEPRAQAIAMYGRVLELLAFGPKPSLALVGGSVKAGGVGLVAACDFVIATSQANFELSEVFFGLIPANVLPYLTAWRLSPARAKFYTLSANFSIALQPKPKV
jgi:enoyl-CoA hydratase/carnithine racemase